MARPKKQGLDYFPHDTDASNEDKVETLIALYGNDGYAMYFRLLERIYRTATGELDVSAAETRKRLAGTLGLTNQRFNQMLRTALKVRLFDREVYQNRKILTSNGIKARYRVVTDKRENMRQKYERLVTDVSASEMDNRNSAETPQRKVKESKGKNSKVNNPLPTASGEPPSKPKRRLDDSTLLEVTKVEKWLEGKRGYVSARFPAERKSIATMIKLGFGADQICAAWHDQKRDPYWKTKELFMMSVEGQIQNWAKRVTGVQANRTDIEAGAQKYNDNQIRYRQGNLEDREWEGPSRKEAMRCGHIPPPHMIKRLTELGKWPDPDFPELAAAAIERDKGE